MPCLSKSKQKLRAQAALAQTSRTASTTQCSTPSVSTSPPAAAASPTPSNTPGVTDEESNDVQKTFKNVCLHLPDSHEGLEEGYHTDDDLLELEDEKLEESLKR